MTPDLYDGAAILTSVAGRGVRIAFIVALVLMARRVTRKVIPQVLDIALRVDRGENAPPPEEQAKRMDTLRQVFIWTTDAAVLIIGGLTALSELGIDIAPVLAGAGVAGVALGFGAQSLVRDVLAGFFVLLENQYGKGDVVQVAGVGGVVEDVNLRRTVLRDLDGTVHTIPNGQISVTSNLTRGWSRVNLNVSVGYGEDLDRVRNVIDRVGAELADDPIWAPIILDAPKVLRVDAFEESGIALKVLATTKPIKQWDVAGELRRRIKKAFDEEGIEIPFPHRVMVQKSEPSRAASDGEVVGVGRNGDGGPQ